MPSQSLQLEGGLRWYPIAIKPRKEGAVEKRLGELHFELFLPWLRVRRRVGTRHQWMLTPLFPGYLFCRLDLIVSGKTVRYTPGVKDFVKFGSRFAEVTEEVVHSLRERCPDGVAQITAAYRAGEAVTIREGPLMGLEAVFEREMKDSQRVAVLLEFLGRPTRVILSSDIIGRP